jgi:hypothetical protein
VRVLCALFHGVLVVYIFGAHVGVSALACVGHEQAPEATLVPALALFHHLCSYTVPVLETHLICRLMGSPCCMAGLAVIDAAGRVASFNWMWCPPSRQASSHCTAGADKVAQQLPLPVRQVPLELSSVGNCCPRPGE